MYSERIILYSRIHNFSEYTNYYINIVNINNIQNMYYNVFREYKLLYIFILRIHNNTYNTLFNIFINLSHIAKKRTLFLTKSTKTMCSGKNSLIVLKKCIICIILYFSSIKLLLFSGLSCFVPEKKITENWSKKLLQFF
jgi:hypothetical protein